MDGEDKDWWGGKNCHLICLCCKVKNSTCHCATTGPATGTQENRYRVQGKSKEKEGSKVKKERGEKNKNE